MSIRLNVPVMASNPVAKTMAARAWSPSSVRIPVGVICWVGGVALVVSHVEGGAIARAVGHRAARPTRLVVDLVIIRLHVLEDLLIVGAMPGRDRVLRCALEHVEAAGLLGAHRDRLHAARA